MKPHIIALTLAALPLAASAQTIVPPMQTTVIGPPGSGAERIAGISVSGRAAAQTPVHDVTFLAYARGIVDAETALAALRAAGVENPTIGPPDGMLMTNAPTLVRGTVRNVSTAKLEALQKAALAFAAAHPGVAVDNVRFFARLDDCARVEEQARSAAFAEARRRAQSIASLAGAALGPVIAVSENGGCSQQDPGSVGMPINIAALTTSLTMFENVTFAIVPANSGKRRPL